MDYEAWIRFMESTDGFPQQVLSVLDRAFRALICEAIRCEEEKDTERGQELSALASDLANVITQFSHDFPLTTS